MSTISTDFILATGTLALQILLALGIALTLLSWRSQRIRSYIAPLTIGVGNNAVLLAFLFLLASLLGSLYYSNIVGFEPCTLCWWLRIFMYPATIILGAALWKSEYTYAVRYTTLLIVPATLLSAYQYALQMGSVPEVCSIGELDTSCSIRYIFEFGYITIPLMAFTINLSILLLLWVHKKTPRGTMPQDVE